MSKSTMLCLAVAVCALFPAQVTRGQDLRVYTSVVNVSHEGESPTILSSSLTLFHAGKVYDYMEEIGEVVIYEPSHHRFIILGKDFSATEVPFAELNHFLEAAQQESVKYIRELASKNSEENARLAATIRFQLQPDFQKNFLEESQTLQFRGSSMNYDVRTGAAPSPEVVNRYLDYADWAARLNYVLHPHSAFPAPRLTLNEALRKRKLLPVQVDRTTHLDGIERLRASHSFSFELQPVDKRHISHWERTLLSDQVRWLTFHEYQQQLLAAQAK